MRRVDVQYGVGVRGTYHRPGQRDPEHSGPLRMSEQDARLIAVPCPECFPAGEVTEGERYERKPLASRRSFPSVTSSTEGEADGR